MKVALVLHHVRATGGQDRYALELARHLAGAVTVTVVAMRAEGLPAGVHLRRVLPPIRPMLLRAPWFRSAASGHLARERFDVVHALGGCWPGATVITAPFCHAAWAAAQPPRGLYQRLVMRQAIADERAAYRHPALRAVIPVSTTTGAELATHYGPLAAPCTIIPNGVDLVRFAPRPRTPRPRPRLLFVGAWDRKGLAVAIEAVARMRTPADLLAIGEGDRAAYLARAHAAGVADRVTLAGPRDGIEAAMADADLLLFPTRYEPFGMVIAEALACGTPVVTTARAGAAELIAAPDAGAVIADPDDAAAFAARADALLARPAETTTAAARAAVQHLGWDRIAARTIAVYQSAA